jgi:hypothetical protein
VPQVRLHISCRVEQALFLQIREIFGVYTSRQPITRGGWTALHSDFTARYSETPAPDHDAGHCCWRLRVTITVRCWTGSWLEGGEMASQGL